MEKQLQELIRGIAPLNETIRKEAVSYLDSLAKPVKSFGRLEDLAAQLAGIQETLNPKAEKTVIIIMSSDNGLVEEGIASAPQIVTTTQTINFIKGKTGVVVLAEHQGSDLMVVDIGINHDKKIDGVIDRKIQKGTNNIYFGPAMTYEDALKGILTGVEMVKTAKEKGYEVIGTGEMGIGNTSTSSAIMALLTGESLDKVVGRGGGITDASYAHKKEVIETALKINQPDPSDPVDIVAKVGGFDIAGMMGIYLGAAYYKIPVVIDGFISAVAALLAYKLCPASKDYMVASHASREPGYRMAMELLGIEPLVNLNMALGEGTGCPFAFYILSAACTVMNRMATFAESNIDDSVLFGR